MSDRIELRGLRAWGRHGVLDGEREVGQAFVIDVVVTLDISTAAESDDLAATLDYGALATGVVGVVEGEPVRLIETLAQRIADHCLAVAPPAAGVREVEVTVHKPHAPIPVPFADVAVTISRGARTPGAGA